MRFTTSSQSGSDWSHKQREWGKSELNREKLTEYLKTGVKKTATLVKLLILALFMALVEILNIMANDRIALQTSDAEMIFVTCYLLVMAVALIVAVFQWIRAKGKCQCFLCLGIALCAFLQLAVSEIYWQNLTVGALAGSILVAMCLDIVALSIFAAAQATLGQMCGKREARKKKQKQAKIGGRATRREGDSQAVQDEAEETVCE